MVLSKISVPGRPTIWMTVGQGPTASAVGAVGGCLDIFSHLSFFSSFSLFLEDGPIQGPSNPKQPTNQPAGRILLLPRLGDEEQLNPAHLKKK